jgi:hypothetical protein
MSSVTREIAKFLAGYAGAETIGHWAMWIWGQHLLPIDLGWFKFTAGLNNFAMIVWPVILAALVYYAWVRTPATVRTSSTPKTPSTGSPGFGGGGGPAPA